MLSKNLQIDTSFWDQHRAVLTGRRGGWVPGKGVFGYGYDMMEELVGKASYFQIIVLSVVGKLPDKPVADWLEAMFSCLSWPDPRIWCNHVGALGGSARATAVAASTAGILAGDSIMFGQYPILIGAQFIQDALKDHKEGMTAEQIVRREVTQHRGKVHIMGYARPLATGDERIGVLERRMDELGFEVGEHRRLAYELDDVLQGQYGESMNVNGLLTSFMSDQGYTPEEIYQIHALSTAAGVMACYAESYQQTPDSFLPLRCDDIEYTGKAPRQVPVD